MIFDKKSREIKAALYPDVFPGKSGRYRFFYDVWIKGKKIPMMTEFLLTDNEQDLKKAVKTAVPQMK